MNNVLNSTDTTILTDLPEIEEIQSLPLDPLVDRLSNLQRPNKLKVKKKPLKLLVFFLISPSSVGPCYGGHFATV